MEQELALKLEEDQIFFQTQVEIPATAADFYLPLDPRPLLVFVNGPCTLPGAQMIKDEKTRTLLRKKGYKILELTYNQYSDKQRDKLCQEIVSNLGRQS